MPKNLLDKKLEAKFGLSQLAHVQCIENEGRSSSGVSLGDQQASRLLLETPAPTVGWVLRGASIGAGDGYETDWELEQQLLVSDTSALSISLHKADSRAFWRQVKAFGMVGHVRLTESPALAQMILVDGRV